MSLRTVSATRYVTPLREGGSMPAVVEADDEGMYVLKFRGAGQGAKALVAELIAGEIARVLGLPIPEIVLLELDPDLARTEPDSEIQHLIRESAGLNLALDLSGKRRVRRDAASARVDLATAEARRRRRDFVHQWLTANSEWPAARARRDTGERRLALVARFGLWGAKLARPANRVGYLAHSAARRSLASIASSCAVSASNICTPGAVSAISCMSTPSSSICCRRCCSASISPDRKSSLP
jgi:hypothetical protein